jgi:hypothetical protein
MLIDVLDDTEAIAQVRERRIRSFLITAGAGHATWAVSDRAAAAAE